MVLILRWFLIIGWMLLYGVTAFSAQTEKTKGNTINILIDVSGSMKQNDPDNQRIAAVRLLINLLPDGSKAGIWLFAEKTGLLLKTTKVDAQWKKKALLAINRIHSRGVYTNIEGAIQTTLKEGFAQSDRKNLILLTDGMVDISKDIMQSAESRERIIVDLVPLLQQQQIRVFTIALSDNADKELLEKLAFDTNGWAESPQLAEQLQKAFLTMFNKALPQENVPLNNNKFVIDNSIKEFSVLLFKKSGARQTQLIRPDKPSSSGVLGKQKITHKTQAENLSWVQDKHYDLITIQQPITGEWRIEADMDPDNQVMVITDLKLNINDLPAYISEQENLDVTVYFTEQGQLIRQHDFLQLIDVSLQQIDDLQRKNTWKMQVQMDNNGFFSQKIGETLGKGRHRLKIVADGKTFQREIVRMIEVVDTPVKIKTTFEPANEMIMLELLPDHEIIDADMMTARADVKRSEKELESFEIKPVADRLLLSLKAPVAGENIIINFSVMAKTVHGKPITPKVKPLMIDEQFVAQIKGATEVKSVADNKLEDVKTEDNRKEADESVEETIIENDQDQEGGGENVTENGSRGLVIIGIVVINLLLIAGGYFGYRYMKKRTAEKQQQLLDRLT